MKPIDRCIIKESNNKAALIVCFDHITGNPVEIAQCMMNMTNACVDRRYRVEKIDTGRRLKVKGIGVVLNNLQNKVKFTLKKI